MVVRVTDSATETALNSSCLKKVANPWAAANTEHGTGFVNVPLEIYLCPKCGTHPTMADDGYGNTGLLCMKCGFGIRPVRAGYKSFEKWNKAVEQYVEHREKGLVKDER